MGDHILVINGSPRGDKGITNVVINTFLEGCHEKGATSEIINMSKVRLSHCAGELACFFNPKATSCQIFKNDQGQEFADKWVNADRIILASPLHFNSVSSYLMRFLERLICIANPLYIENDGFPTHKVPYEPKPSAVIGVCAYPGVFNFNLFREVMLNYQKVFWLEPAGNILVPMARDLAVLSEINPRFEPIKEVVASIKRAGHEFMENNEIAMETEDAISADTDDYEKLMGEYDGYFLRLNA